MQGRGFTRGVLPVIAAAAVVCAALLFAVLPLLGQTAPQSRPLSYETFTEFTWIRLDDTVHAMHGADARKGRALYIGPDRSLYAARARSVLAINPERTRDRYYWLPDSVDANIVSIYVSRTSLWLGLSNGRVARCTLSTNAWKTYRVHESAPIRLWAAEGSLLAFETRTGGRIWFLNEAADEFQHYFNLPDELDVMPITPFRIHARSWYMGSDMGLFRIERPGLDTLAWELCGTREGLAQTIIHDTLPAQAGLLLAGSRPQYPRLPRNIRPTSYGYFTYNYLQGRWERLREPLPAKLEQFLSMNAANTQIPSNGLWWYENGKDIAYRIRGSEGDFYRLAAVTPELTLAASRRGVFLVGIYQGEYRALRILDVPDLWIDDITGDAQNVYILAGRGIFVLPKSRFNAGIFERALLREAPKAESAGSASAAAETAIENEAPSESGRQAQSGTASESASSVNGRAQSEIASESASSANGQAQNGNGTANGQPQNGNGAANGQPQNGNAAANGTSANGQPQNGSAAVDAEQAGRAAQDGLPPARGTYDYSEEMRFMRQIERYLRQLQ